MVCADRTQLLWSTMRTTTDLGGQVLHHRVPHSRMELAIMAFVVVAVVADAFVSMLLRSIVAAVDAE